MGDCNTSSTKGCQDDSSFVKLKSTNPKLLTKLEEIESTLDNFSQSLSLYCEAEQLNLTNIKNRLTDVVNVNAECCSLINLKLQELLVVIGEKEICDATTTEEVTTTVAPPPPTTTVAATTTSAPTTTLLCGGLDFNGFGLTSVQVDEILSCHARAGTTNATIDLRGNDLRTSASDADVLTLTNDGCQILEDL